MKQNRTINILFFITFISMLLILALLTNTKEYAVSNVDGKGFASMSTFGTGEYTREVEAWMRENLGMQSAIKSAYEATNDRLFDELVNPIYQYGRDGHVFFKLHNNVEYNDYHKHFTSLVKEMQEYCESRGSVFYYVFNPEKESIYKDYLPIGVNYNDEWVDSMLDEMARLGINYIDLKEPLTKRRKEGVFNSIYDAGHWNHTGAFYGMKKITEVLHRDIPKVKPLEKREYDISSQTIEQLYSSNQRIKEEIPKFALKTVCTDITGDLSTELVRNEKYSFFQLVRNDADEASGISRMLLFQDDLYGMFAFARSRETAVLPCLENTVNFDYYYNIFKPDVVIFENMEYVVQDTYFSKEAIDAVENNPAILENYPENGFTDRKNQLLDRTEEVYIDISAVLVPGKAIDRVFLSRGLTEARYAYLITDERVIDLKENGQGAFTASIMHGDLTDNSKVVLYTLKGNGVGRYAVIPITSKKKDIAVKDTASDNTVYDKEDSSFTMTLSLDGEAFSYTAIQLYDENISEYYEGSSSLISQGIVDGAYCHRLPTGNYTILLRAGSSRTSEWKSFKVHLVEGQSYWFTYNVEKFSEKEVVISDFSFSKPAETGIEDLTAE